MKIGSRLVGALLCASVAMVGSVVASAGPASAIVGGTAANVANYPYFATFPQPYGAPASCDGSVIADSWVLTAAHCVNAVQASPYVYVPAARTTSVGQVIPHPLW